MYLSLMNVIVPSSERCMVRLRSTLKEQIISDSLEHRFLRKIRVQMGVLQQTYFYAGEKLDSCLHKYMIKDAIADGNVLRFSVEYQRTIFARNLAVKGIDPEQAG